MIDGIRLTNFKSHANTNIKFEQGINVIVGENGSGKTSILDAINFALFKQKPRDLKFDDLIRLGEKEMRVEAIFSINNKKLKVRRIRKKGGSTENSLYINNKPYIRGNIDKEIEKIIGIDSDVFTRAVYVKQGEIDALISMEPSKRKIEINKLLGINEIEKAWDSLREIIRDFELRLKLLERVPEEIEEKKKKIENITNETEELREKLTGYEKNLDLIRNELSFEENALKNLEKIKDLIIEREKIVIEKRSLEEKLKNIEIHEKEIKKSENGYKRYLSAEESLKKLKNKEKDILIKLREIESLKEELVRKKEKFRKLDETLRRYELELKKEIRKNFDKFKKDIEDKKKRIKEEIDNLISKKEEIIGKIREVDGILIQIEKSKKSLENVKGRCPVCRSVIDEERKRKIINEYKEEMENLKALKKAYKKNLEKIEEKISMLEKELRDFEKINIDAIAIYIKDLEELRKEQEKIIDRLSNEEELREIYKKIRKDIENNEKMIEILREDYERYITAQRFLNNVDKKSIINKINELNERLSSLNNTFMDLLKKREVKDIIKEKDFESIKLSNVEKEIKLRKEKINKLRENILRLERETARMRTLIERNLQSIEELKKEVDELKKKKKEFEKLKYFISLLRKIRDVLSKDKLQKELRNRFRPIIEKYTKEIFERFNIEFSDLRITEDFSIEIFTRNGKKKVESLSGGERIALAIALRLAIAKILSQGRISFMMFDEPTIHLDQQRKKILINIIKDIGKFIPQIIVVTHDREFEEAADNLIVLEKINGTSKVVEG